MINIPTLVDLYNRFITSFQTNFGISSIPTKSTFRPLAKVHAGELKPIYLAIGDLQKNILPDTAGPEAAGGTLERWGRVFLNRKPFPATQGVYTATVSGEAMAVIPASTTFKSDDDSLSPGYLYILDNAYTMTGSDDVITLRALTAGLEAELEAGNTLTATAPILNVNSQATVATITTSPVDAESLTDYRIKLLTAIRLKSGSWSAIDYRLIGGEVNGVKQIYAYATSGSANEVDVFIEGEVDGTPVAGSIITDYETALELVRPITVRRVNYYATPILDVDIIITQVGTLSSAQRNLINTALTDAIILVRPFIAACDVLADRNDTIATNYIDPYNTNIIQVISSAIPGVAFGAVTFTISGTSQTSYQFDNGNIPYLNSVTYA